MHETTLYTGNGVNVVLTLRTSGIGCADGGAARDRQNLSRSQAAPALGKGSGGAAAWWQRARAKGLHGGIGAGDGERGRGGVMDNWSIVC